MKLFQLNQICILIGLNQKQKGGAKDSWFKLWYEASNLPERSAKNWWNAAKKDGAVTGTPAKGESQKQTFFDWLKTAQDDEAAKAKLKLDTAGKAVVKAVAAYRACDGATEDALNDLIYAC